MTATRALHPLAEVFPAMPDAELRALADDIKANDLRDDIVLFAGKILDGRHCHQACVLAGVETRFTTFESTEADALKIVVSRNLHRRHLSESQRAMIAADLANMTHGGDQRSDQAASVPVDSALAPVTQARAAGALKVSERSVRNEVLVKKAAPELAEKVRTGKVSVSGAAAQAREQTKPRKVKATPARRRLHGPTSRSAWTR